ncbi:MAG: PQQ-binding-like beta-propeller repeat protein, partial [Armatimonadota bacterium]
SAGDAYAQTRKDGYAELFAWLVRRAKEHHDTDPGTYGGPWGMDSDFRIHRVLPMWDQVEESPALTDEDRLAVTRILFEWVADVGVRKARSAVGNERVRFNHQTFPALGLLFAGEYFTKYYQAAEAKHWTSIADAAFQMQSQAFKPYEDCNGYQWLTLYHTMLYALAKPDFSFFDNGNARRCADFAILCMDNLGYQVTYGDTGAFTGWWSEMPFLYGALWHHRDGRYAWALEKKLAVSNRANLGQYHTGAEGVEPEGLTGAIAWPLDPYYYQTFGGPEKLDEERAVDKVVFRDGFDPEDQYLLLDGLSNGGHKHLDGNSISRWTENGRIWLADADYILSLPKYHNGVLIFRDGQSQRIPDFVELERVVDLPSFGASTTTYRGYAGVDWRRHILWLKGKCFVVADELVAQEDGDYSFRVVWNTVGEAKLTDAGMSIHQDGQYAAIAVTPECRLTLDDDAAYGKNWSGYPHIREPVVRVMRGIRDCTLKAGERVVLFSLLHASGETPSDAGLVRLNENRVAVTGLGEPMQVGLGGVDWRLAGEGAPAWSVKAEAAVLSTERVLAIGASEIEGQGDTREFAAGADVAWDLEAGEAHVVEPSVTTAGTRPAGGQMRVGVVPAGRMRAALEAALAAAPRVQRPTAAGVAAPRELRTLWSYGEKLDAYLLTNNRGAFEAIDAGLTLTCTPEPLAANVFSGEAGENTLDNVVDGGVQGTEDAAMWDDDQPVSVELAFDGEYDIEKLVLKAWFATASSKDKVFQLGRLVAEASNDGFERDVRGVVDFRDTEEHGNWGAPGHAPHVYEFEVIEARARALRLKLTPRPGTAIYIAELEVWGNREGLAREYAASRREALPAHTFPTVTMADLNGDGVDELIAGSTNGKVYALDAAGGKLWEAQTGGGVTDVAVVDFAGDGRPAIVAGSMGATATALSAAGEELWSFAVPYYKRTGHVRVVFAADLAGDGRQTAIIGADNWHFYAIDGAGKQVWQYESVHGSTCGAAADVDGDGKQEVIAGTEYYWWHVVKPDAGALFKYSTRGGPHANAATAANLDGDATRCVVFGGADGNVHVLGPDGTLRWLFNTGDEVTSVAAADINGDGRDEVLAASMSFNVYCMDAAGEALWRRDLRAEVTSLAQAAGEDASLVLATSRDRGVYALDPADGKVLAGLRLGASPLALATGAGPNEVRIAAITSADGDVRVVEVQ